MSSSDEAFYEYVGREIQSGLVRAGLWTMALAKSGYDETRAKAIYIEYRVQALKEELVESVHAAPPKTAIERLEEELTKEKADAMAVWRGRMAAAENARLEKWKSGIKVAKKHIANPIPAALYARKHNVSVEEISVLIGKGNLRGYSVGGELYVEDSQYPQATP